MVIILAIVCVIPYDPFIIGSALTLEHPLLEIDNYLPAIGKRRVVMGLLPVRKRRLSKAKYAMKGFKFILFTVIAVFVLRHINGAETFQKSFSLAYVIYIVIDWYDAIIFDSHPGWRKTPDTEDMPEHRDY